MASLKEIAESILMGLQNLNKTGWQTVEQECSRCKGTGNVMEYQDGQIGQEWCPSCGGPGFEYDETKLMEMKIELIVNHLRQAGITNSLERIA